MIDFNFSRWRVFPEVGRIFLCIIVLFWKCFEYIQGRGKQLYIITMNSKFTIKIKPAVFSARSASKSARRTKFAVIDCESRAIQKWGYRYLNWRFCHTVWHKQLTELVHLLRNSVMNGCLLHIHKCVLFEVPWFEFTACLPFNYVYLCATFGAML